MSDDRMSRIVLRPADLSDSERFWQWRNDAATRRASFRGDEIARDAHERWFADQLSRADRRLFVALDASATSVGSIRFDLHGADVEVSVVIAPDRRGQGLGPVVLIEAGRRIFAETGAARIVALIRRENATSRAAFERAGFVFESDVEIEGIPAIRMTLGRAE